MKLKHKILFNKFCSEYRDKSPTLRKLDDLYYSPNSVEKEVFMMIILLCDEKFFRKLENKFEGSSVPLVYLRNFVISRQERKIYNFKSERLGIRYKYNIISKVLKLLIPVVYRDYIEIELRFR